MFYNDLKNKNESDRVNNPGKSIPFSGLPKKSLDRKPLKFSTVFCDLSNFIDIIHKVLAPVQPFGRPKPCKIQGINPGQATDFPGNNQNTIQNDVLLIPPKKTIRFDGHLESYQKPLTFDHINHTYQRNILILPFSFTIISYITCIQILQNPLTFFDGRVYSRFDPWSLFIHDNQPLTIDTMMSIPHNDHIQTTSLNEVSKYADNNHSLIYGSEICYENIKNKHCEAMAINDYSSKIDINKMHKNYAYFLIVYVYISYLVYIIYCLYGFNEALAERGWFGRVRPSNMYIYMYKI